MSKKKRNEQQWISQFNYDNISNSISLRILLFAYGIHYLHGRSSTRKPKNEINFLFPIFCFFGFNAVLVEISKPVDAIIDPSVDDLTTSPPPSFAQLRSPF